MNMNNRGKASGLALALLLIVALIVAFLVMKQMGSLNVGGGNPTASQGQSAVQEARELVNQINNRMMAPSENAPAGADASRS